VNLIRNLGKWRQFFVWKLSNYKDPITFVARLKNGIEVPVRGEQRYEFKLMFMSHEYLWPIPNKRIDGVIIDLGANVGYFTLYSAFRYPHCKILSFEPFPRNFRVLENNIRQNSLTNCTAVQCAVCGRSGDAVFGVETAIENPTEPHIVENLAPDEKNFFTVPCLSLDDVIEKHSIEKIGLLKIDIEGSEYDVLYNISDVNYKKIQRIGMETEDIDEQRNTPRLRRFLEGKGYQTVEVTPHLVHCWRV
jgi:FkbM family methyltransferase